MKNTLILIAAIVLLVVLGGGAQTYGGLGFGTIAPAVASCPAGLANMAMLCAVGTSATGYTTYISYNAGAYQLLVPAAAPAVTSFNGRTGAVILTDADVAGAGVKVSTTVTSTATSTVQ